MTRRLQPLSKRAFGPYLPNLPHCRYQLMWIVTQLLTNNDMNHHAKPFDCNYLETEN